MTLGDGVIARAQMSNEELEAVAQLVGACITRDRIDPRINWSALTARSGDVASDFLCYRDGALVGFLALDGLGDDAAEGSGLVHPKQRRRGAFRALVEAARAACRAAGTASLLLAADRTSKAAKPVAVAIGAAFTRAEYKMALDKAQYKPTSIPFALDVIPATEADAPAIAAIIAEDDNADPASLVGFVTLMMQRPDQRYFIARCGETPVATLRVETMNNERYIYGFVVAQAERGKGYGRETLVRSLQYAFAGYDDAVLLEVDETNTTARNLYRSVGFEDVCVYDYYQLDS